jgi:hypothetical protein
MAHYTTPQRQKLLARLQKVLPTVVEEIYDR